MGNTSCILTVIKNEHEYLDEWIRYHLDLGVDHIFIFEDMDSESHKVITDRYGDKVSLCSILSILSDEDKSCAIELKLTKKRNAQEMYILTALSNIQKEYKNQYDWCFVIDNDEFITLENENTSLKEVISSFDGYDAFIMQWKCYGANGLVHKPDYTNKGIIETYTKEIQGHVPTATPQSLTKSCYNLNTYREEYFLYLHQPSRYCNFCRTNFERDRNKPVYDKIYIRHYITKSWEEYVWKKKTRGYFFGRMRTFDSFFTINTDMLNMKEELINRLNEGKLVVLPYKQSSSQGNELRIALNAWRKFCTFKYHFIVIGEFDDKLKLEFPWVEFINCPSIDKKEGQYNPHLDIQNKFKIVSRMYSQSYNGFIYMTDDEYAIKPFDLKDVTSVFYHSASFIGCEPCPTSFWRHDKWKTRQLLDREHLPHVNYTTHHPYFMEFKKLDEIRKKYNLLNESYVFDDIYFNYFKHEEPVLDSKIRLGIWSKGIFQAQFQKAIEDPNIKFVCNSVEGWSKELETALENIATD